MLVLPFSLKYEIRFETKLETINISKLWVSKIIEPINNWYLSHLYIYDFFF
jgi:hypothetical protein